MAMRRLSDIILVSVKRENQWKCISWAGGAGDLWSWQHHGGRKQCCWQNQVLQSIGMVGKNEKNYPTLAALAGQNGLSCNPSNLSTIWACGVQCSTSFDLQKKSKFGSWFGNYDDVSCFQKSWMVQKRDEKCSCNWINLKEKLHLLTVSIPKIFPLHSRGAELGAAPPNPRFLGAAPPNPPYVTQRSYATLR